MKKIIILSLVLVVLFMVGCASVNEGVVCKNYCGGEPIYKTSLLNGKIKVVCTGGELNNLSRLDNGYSMIVECK